MSYKSCCELHPKSWTRDRVQFIFSDYYKISTE
nr:MAG TPA: hypothetical protein [Caudoviricetes sp.]